MYFNSEKHYRRSIRLKGYDYSQAGLYFIAICVQGKLCLFGSVEYICGIKQFGWHPFDKRLWQRNYWEHIIRNSKSYENISNYIVNNPTK